MAVHVRKVLGVVAGFLAEPLFGNGVTNPLLGCGIGKGVARGGTGKSRHGTIGDFLPVSDRIIFRISGGNVERRNGVITMSFFKVLRISRIRWLIRIDE